MSLMDMLPEHKREYCCSRCGLIWFATTTIANKTTCPECKNNNREGIIFSCDSFAFAYAIDKMIDDLRENCKDIHYALDHPLHPNNKNNEV